jgi:hypothetical protein
LTVDFPTSEIKNAYSVFPPLSRPFSFIETRMYRLIYSRGKGKRGGKQRRRGSRGHHDSIKTCSMERSRRSFVESSNAIQSHVPHTHQINLSNDVNLWPTLLDVSTHHLQARKEAAPRLIQTIMPKGNAPHSVTLFGTTRQTFRNSSIHHSNLSLQPRSSDQLAKNSWPSRYHRRYYGRT